ncbi:hypothetical protein ACLOJK_010337 [Asimina triloba]
MKKQQEPASYLVQENPSRGRMRDVEGGLGTWQPGLIGLWIVSLLIHYHGWCFHVIQWMHGAWESRLTNYAQRGAYLLAGFPAVFKRVIVIVIMLATSQATSQVTSQEPHNTNLKESVLLSRPRVNTVSIVHSKKP